MVDRGLTVLTDPVHRGVTATAARTLSRRHSLQVRQVGWDDEQLGFRPIRHVWRVEGSRPAGTRPPTGEVVRDHHHLSDRPAPGHLHPVTPVGCFGDARPPVPDPDPKGVATRAGRRHRTG